MASEWRGSVHVKETGVAVGDVWVRLVKGKKPSPDAVRTGDDGAFRVTGDGGGKIVVADRNRKLLAELAVRDSGPSALRIEVPLDVLSGAAVRSGEEIPVLRAAVLDTLAGGIAQLDGTMQATARMALERLTCGLPPIVTVPRLVNLARDVLEGRAGAATRFREHLAQFEAWNAARYPTQAAPPVKEIEALLEEELRTAERPPHEHRVDRDRTAETEVLVTLLAAAALVNGGDPVRLWRGVQAVFGQLQALASLRPLVREARAASLGTAGAAEAFQYALALFGGLCIRWFRPFPHPGGGDPPPFPDPGGWHDSSPMGVPGVSEECPEAARVVAAAVAARGIRFTVTRLEPEDACPGETLMLHGTGLSPRGLVPMVGFEIEGSRSRRFVTATSFSNTRIEVRVPDDAVCGELELHLPVQEPIDACGTVIAFNATPTGPIAFQGGRTRISGLLYRPSGCAHSGDEVELAWQVCNADALELTVEITEAPPSDGSPGTGLGTAEVIRLDPDEERYTVRLPDLRRNASLRVTLVATSRCGRDERSLRVGIQRAPSDEIFPFRSVLGYTNWHGNVTRPAVAMAAPATLDELVGAVRAVERVSLRVGVEGSRWSFTDCIAPMPTTPFVIDSSGLNRTLNHVLPAAGLDTVESVLSDLARARIDLAVSAAEPLTIRQRLVHVEAGIKLWDLNCRLDAEGLATPNLGGSRGQSLAGAINTGTHGATVQLPPIPDLVRAIHLVANGGQQWWIERGTRPVTDEGAMRELMARGVLDPCLELEYDDQLFDACLVAMGHAGVVYAMVVETVPLHNLFEDTRRLSWDVVAREIRTDILEATGPLPWFYEVSVNPSRGRPAWVTRRTPTSLPIRATPPPPDTTLSDALWRTLFGTTAAALGPAGLIGLGSGALAFVMGGLSTYFIRRSAELLRIFTNPFEWWRIPEIQQELDLIQQLVHSVDDVVDAISAAADGDAEAADRALAEGLPDLLSALWRIGFYVVSGRQILDTIQNLVTNLDQRPPGTDIGKSYTILTEQPDCATTPGAEQTHSALERLIHSQEYAVPADQLVSFTEAILDEADAVRNDEDDALILILNLRFVQRTEASLGLQQFPLTGMAEVWTIDRVEGNESFHARVNRLANSYEALPHWGHVHEVQDLTGRFPRHAEWRRQLDIIARTAGRPNTFRHRFGIARGLLNVLA